RAVLVKTLAGAAGVCAVISPALVARARPAASPAAAATRVLVRGSAAVAGSSPAPADAEAEARYRVAGCRSSGLLAYRHGPAAREVAIGFDDGPARDTPAFVRMLERVRARATFFLIGRQLGPAYRATLLREL